MTYTILLVEDDIWLAELYKDVLEHMGGCTVLHATQAAAALDCIDTQPQIDLIILDMFLPQHNGVELLHELASYQDSFQIPVIILSSVSERDFGMSKERWRQYRVRACLDKAHTKPQDLLSVVKKQLAIAEGVQ